MATDPVPLAYASPEPMGVEFKMIRRMFAAFAAGCGISHGVRDGLGIQSFWHINLILWPQWISPIATLPICIVLIVGAGLTLRGHAAGTWVIRIAALSLCVADAMAGIGWEIYSASNKGSRPYPPADFAQGVFLAVIGAAFSAPALLFGLSFPLRRPR